MAYLLDSTQIAGMVVVKVDGHRSYLAESFHAAELFAQRLEEEAAIVLPPPATPLCSLTLYLLEQFTQRT